MKTQLFIKGKQKESLLLKFIALLLVLILGNTLGVQAQTNLKTYVVYQPVNTANLITPFGTDGVNGATTSGGQTFTATFTRVTGSKSGPMAESAFPASLQITYNVGNVMAANGAMTSGTKAIGWNSIGNTLNLSFSFGAMFPGNTSFGSTALRSAGILNYVPTRWGQNYDAVGNINISKNNGGYPNLPSTNRSAVIEGAIPTPRNRTTQSYTVPGGWTGTGASSGNLVVANYAPVTQTPAALPAGFSWSSNFPVVRMSQSSSAFQCQGSSCATGGAYSFNQPLRLDPAVQNSFFTPINGVGHASGAGPFYIDYAIGWNNNAVAANTARVGNAAYTVQMMPQSIEACPTITITSTGSTAVGSTNLTLKATVAGLTGNVLGGTWTSSATSVATLNKGNALTTGIIGVNALTVGTTTITFTSVDGCKKTFLLTITSPSGRMMETNSLSEELTKDGDNLDLKLNENETILVAPNPVRNSFHIEGLNNENKTVNILNEHGKLVKSAVLLQKEGSISLEGLESGIYYLKAISQNGKVSTVRIIKE